MSQLTSTPERGVHNIEGGRNYDVFDGIDASALLRSHSPLDAPPSYDAFTDATNTDEKNKTAMLEDSPAQLLFKDPIAGPSLDSPRRSLPTLPPHTPPPPSPLNPQTQSSEEASRQRELSTDSRTRPQLPHAPRSAPDPRGRARLEHVKELEEVDPFGNRFHDESPFEAGRRAQRVGDGIPSDTHPRGHTLPDGRMPSVKPGEIMPVNTMRPLNGVPAFFPPSAAPPFPPTIHHAPIRPAHFPPEMHPPSPQQLVREPSYQQGPPHHPQPTRSYSHQHPPPSSPPQPIRSQSYQHAPSQLAQTHSYSPSPPPPQRPPHESQPSAPPVPRRHTYDARGIPPGLTPNGRYGAPPPAGVPPMPTPSAPHGYSQSQPYPQPYPSNPPPRGMPQPQLQPGRSILRAPQRSSMPPPRHTPSIPSPAPVRLPSQNVPPLNGVVHTPPAPSNSPRPDPTRAPRATPKPVMPQLLAPLVAHDSNHRAQLQRSASVAPLPSEKGGLLSKTRSILRKRNSSSGIKTHADGAISFAPQSGGSAKMYENHVPALPPLREEPAGGGGKLGKRLSKRK